ncbi:DUF2312 domain-containing protein [Rhizobium leguminosarum]|uniref:DUF2312 domain-containing protein n=1 Tax=Rhizobium ruizarguesonis TaxID=2081791 RepID=UPI00040C7B4D|nr:DUF2312 domain-containing protein [Rhizobium leguminosarum bv. trifolii TA1]
MTADKQLKAYIDRVLRLKEEQDTIGDDIREIYAEAKAAGYDKTIMGKLVAHLRRELKQGAGAVAEAESIFDTYLNAYQRASGTPVATHTHEEEFDPITGEFLDKPVNAKLVATVATGMQTETGRKALIAAVDIMIAREDAVETPSADIRAEGREVGPAVSLRDPVANAGEEAADESAAVSVDPASRASEESERQRASMVGFTDDCRTGGKEQVAAAPVPVGEADARSLPANSPEAATTQRANVPPQHEAGNGQAIVQNSGVTVVGTERGTVSNSQFDPSEDRKEDHSLDGNADASVGGRHVTAQANRAATAGALVQVAPATKPLRPHCRNPGEHCGGYGSNHCHSCLRASKEAEVAA